MTNPIPIPQKSTRLPGAAPSQDPRPDIYLNSPYREGFLQAVADVCASALNQCCPDRGWDHVRYVLDASRNRARLAVLRAKEADRPKPAHAEMCANAAGKILEHTPFLKQEVGRRLAYGVPAGIDRSDLWSRGGLALVVAVANGTKATRLAIRHALDDLCEREWRHERFAAELSASAPTDMQLSEEVGEAVYRLSPQRRDVVLLLFYGGLTQQEAARLLNRSQADISVLSADALRDLSGFLKAA